MAQLVDLKVVFCYTNDKSLLLINTHYRSWMHVRIWKESTTTCIFTSSSDKFSQNYAMNLCPYIFRGYDGELGKEHVVAAQERIDQTLDAHQVRAF